MFINEYRTLKAEYFSLRVYHQNTLIWWRYGLVIYTLLDNSLQVASIVSTSKSQTNRLYLLQKSIACVVVIDHKISYPKVVNYVFCYASCVHTIVGILSPKSFCQLCSDQPQFSLLFNRCHFILTAVSADWTLICNITLVLSFIHYFVQYSS